MTGSFPVHAVVLTLLTYILVGKACTPDYKSFPCPTENRRFLQALERCGTMERLTLHSHAGAREVSTEHRHSGSPSLNKCR
jgi:hypothetical protein